MKETDFTHVYNSRYLNAQARRDRSGTHVHNVKCDETPTLPNGQSPGRGLVACSHATWSWKMEPLCRRERLGLDSRRHFVHLGSLSSSGSALLFGAATSV